MPRAGCIAPTGFARRLPYAMAASRLLNPAPCRPVECARSSAMVPNAAGNLPRTCRPMQVQTKSEPSRTRAPLQPKHKLRDLPLSVHRIFQGLVHALNGHAGLGFIGVLVLFR